MTGVNPLTRKLRTGELVALDAAVATLPLLSHFLLSYLFDGVPRLALWYELPFAAAIVLRRLSPLTATAALVAGAAVGWVWDTVTFGTTLATVLALVLVPYAVGLLTFGWRAVAGLAAGLLAIAMLSLPDPEPVYAVTWVVIGAAAWTTGRAVGVRREYLSRVAARHTQQALAAERLRIARDLHDVVAHSMTLITVQSGVAALAVHQHPDAAAEALRTIEKTGRASVAELRRVLGVLRADTDEGSGADEGAGAVAERAPAPGLRDLPELARRARQAGVEVTMTTTGGAELDDGMALSVYRIVQEALTNVVKHAAPAACRVDVAVGRDAVTIEVVDDGPGTRVLPGHHDGHGLVGMRERVGLYGGRFAAGPRPGGGFGVAASWDNPGEAG